MLLSVSVHGTPGDDNISVSLGIGNSLVVNVNGAQSTYDAAQYAGGISIDTGNAHAFDTLSIAGLPAVQTTARSGGLLKATIGSGARGLQDIAATSLQLGGSTGTLQLTVEDSADPTPRHLILDAATSSGVTYDVLHGLTPGDISAAASLLVVNLGDAGNTIDVNATAYVPPGFDVINLNTGNGDDTVNVNGTAAGTILNVNGQNGHDTVNVTTQSHHGVVNVNNPLGRTTLLVMNDAPHTPGALLDTFSAAGATYGSLTGVGPGAINFDGANMDRVSVSGGISGIQFLTVNNTPGGGDISFSNTSEAVVNGVAANQVLDVGNIFPGARGPVTVDFTTGRIMPGAQIFTHVPVLNVYCSTSDPCTYDGHVEHNGAAVSTDDLDIEQINFSGPPGHPTTRVFVQGNPFNPLAANQNPHVIISGEAVITDTEYYLRNIYADLMTVARTPVPLTHFAEFGPGAGYGRLDITNNEAIFDQGNAADIRNQVRAGLAGGSGITSSLSDGRFGIGITDHGTDFAGNPAVDVRYARWGDANLDGTVNFSDLLIVAQNYGRTDTIWDHGDFNYDGTVGFADLLKLGQNYGGSGSATAAQPGSDSLLLKRSARSALPARQRKL